MQDLLLIRHAEAEEQSLPQGDATRRLTAHGEQQAHALASVFRGFSLPPDTELWYSPKERTRQTAAALQSVLPKLPAIAQPALADGDFPMLQAEWEARGISALILVGHQPFLGDWTALLTGVHLPVSKASLIWLRQGPARMYLAAFLRVDALAILGLTAGSPRL